MSKYISEREKIKNFIEKNIIPAVFKKDLDYYKVINGISSQLFVNQGKIEYVLKELLESNQLKEVRILTIPDEEISDFLSYLKKEEIRKEDLDKEMVKIEELVTKKNDIGV